MDEPPKIRLTKKVFSSEPHRSKQKADADTRHLREAVVAASRVSAFYHRYQADVAARGQSSNVMPRDSVQLLTQMANQTLFVCEQVDPDPDQIRIVAASVLWEHEVPVPSSAPTNIRGFDAETFLEFGTQVSILNGHALQWVLTAVTLIERFALDPTGILVAATYGDNDRAARNFVDTMKFREWPEVPATWDSMRLHHMREDQQEHRGVRWFRPTLQTVKAAAAVVLDLCDRPIREAQRIVAGSTTNKIRFEFDQASFQKVTFADIKNMARCLTEADIIDLPSLRVAVGNRTVTDTFIYLP